MSIVQEAYTFLQRTLLPKLSTRHRTLFTFGFESLTLRPFVSLNSNARMTIANRNTAESKIYRLVSNNGLLTYFQQFVSHLKLVTSKDTINVDFSSFCGFEVLTFAKQTSLGRSLPVYFAVIQHPIKDEYSQTLFIMEEIKKLKALVGFCPHLVFDRGFESPYIVPFLVEERIPFTMRFKKDKHVLYKMKDIPLRNLPWYEKDTLVTLYQEYGLQQQLRVVVSEKLSERVDSLGNSEPWYIITNDFSSVKEQVIARYYFRFEIEETFKDLKHIVSLKKFYKMRKEQTFKILLWFCVLFVWLSFLLEKTRAYIVKRVKYKRHKKLSVTRFFAESIQLELFTLLKKQFF